VIDEVDRIRLGMLGVDLQGADHESRRRWPYTGSVGSSARPCRQK
jgi:hypothetical protein